MSNEQMAKEVTKFQQCSASTLVLHWIVTHCWKSSLTFEKYEAYAGLVSQADEEGD